MKKTKKKASVSLIALTGAIFVLAVAVSIAAESAENNILFMGIKTIGCDQYPSNLYLYDIDTEIMGTVKDDCNDTNGGSLNPLRTKIVYAVGLNEGSPRIIKKYDIATKITSTISTAVAEGAAVFNEQGEVLYISFDTGILNKMQVEGTNISIVATPEAPYKFTMLWISPDLSKICLVEENAGNARLIMMNSDGSERKVVKSQYVGSWYNLTWRIDSTGFMYFHHIYQNTLKFDKHLLVELSDGNFTTKDLSDSDLGKPGNILLATKLGNFLSLNYLKLYDGRNGGTISDRSSDVPLMTEGWFGYDSKGNLYFSDTDGSNVRIFTESTLSQPAPPSQPNNHAFGGVMMLLLGTE